VAAASGCGQTAPRLAGLDAGKFEASSAHSSLPPWPSRALLTGPRDVHVFTKLDPTVTHPMGWMTPANALCSSHPICVWRDVFLRCLRQFYLRPT